MTSTYVKGIFGERIGYLIGISESPSIREIAVNTLDVVPGSQLFFVLEDKYCGIHGMQGFVFANPSDEQQDIVLNTPEEGAEAQIYSTYDGTPVIGYYSSVGL